MPKGIYKRTEKHIKNMSDVGKEYGSKNGFKKGHGLMGSNPTSRGKTWKLGPGTKEKQGISKIGNKNCLGKKNALGYRFTEEQKIKLYKNGQSPVINEKKHLDTKYREWMFSVKNRDNWKCLLLNDNCLGKLESHHIFNWVEYPELRYIVNNGITLCNFHHPRGRENEVRMVPIFQELINNIH